MSSAHKDLSFVRTLTDIRCGERRNEFYLAPDKRAKRLQIIRRDVTFHSFSTFASSMNFSRLFHRYKLKFLLWCLALLIVYQLVLLTPSFSKRRRTSTYTNGFTRDDIDTALQRYDQIKSEYQLTGIVLHWQRRAGVQNLVKTMLDYSDIFSEILVWNNNPKVNLTFADLLIDEKPHVRIINSKENIKDLAKYRACEAALTKACFYVDDDWDIRWYARSLYASFLLEPTILHAITDQYTYFTNLMWTFFDERMQLHTGFSWIGCGSIFSRENAVRHLNYLDLFLREDEYQSEFVQSSNLRFLLSAFSNRSETTE